MAEREPTQADHWYQLGRAFDEQGQSASAVAAYGAFVIPQVFGEQIKAATPENALYGFAIFYGVCLLLNWWYYLGPKAEFKNP